MDQFSNHISFLPIISIVIDSKEKTGNGYSKWMFFGLTFDRAMGKIPFVCKG